MCSVQVVLFAEVMGRELRRPGAGVCRRLFSSEAPPTGAADPGRFLRAMEAELRRRDTERWNFDFQKEKPLPGRYLWVPMGKQSANNNELKSSADKTTTPELKDVIVDEVRPSKVSIPKRRKSSSAGAVANQAKITDFMKKRKRTDLEESSANKLKVRRLSSTLATSTPTLSPSVGRPT
ncbi:hypothetical protein JTE90_008483 [Oedothorax gibbosus]|uniref:Cyclin-dependent kinase inhibitor domain-containing protein n=1 Tax=Oedothorax gibbosus TaxID=931172 RepID=A0AAV6UYL0_9ARAC|nr:hypothetical protein JTE90_008483 [Oedothorax gibbosus]